MEPAALISVSEALRAGRSWPCHPRRARPTAWQGYTLVELLIAVAIGSFLMIGTASMLISHIQSSARMEGLMRLQEAWSRVQFLLDQEIQEARIEAGSPSSVNCSSLSLRIPNPAGGEGQITYSRTGDGTLTRSGPSVNEDGTLDFNVQANDEPVIRGVTSFCPTVRDGTVAYTLGLRDASGVTYQNSSNPSAARSRSRVIE
jgi:prepilin-type N-terminal cleavage/methylation domain-containing protein